MIFLFCKSGPVEGNHPVEEGWEENPSRDPVCTFPAAAGSWRAWEPDTTALAYLLGNDFSANGV